MDLEQYLDVHYDQRDFDFAKKYNLDIKTVVKPLDEDVSYKVKSEAYAGQVH